VFCEWEQGNNIPRLKKVVLPHQHLTHIFQYDDHDCARIHILQGNLTGEPTVTEQQYTIATTFNDEYWPIARIEDNGKKTQYSYEGKTRIIESNSNDTVRRIFEIDDVLEEVTIDDLSISAPATQTKRHWKKTYIDRAGSSTKMSIFIGTSLGDDEYHLRREEYINSEDGDAPVHIFDSENLELFPFKKAVYSNDNALLAVLGYPDFDQLDHDPMIPLSVTYTSRQTPATIIYTNGKQKQLRYFPDGQLRSIIYPDGSTACFEKDCFGRKLQCLYYPRGATEPIIRTYRYEGFSLIEFEDSPGYTYSISKDLFNRPIEFHQSYQGSCIQRIRIACDGLNRIVALDATGKTRYQKQYDYQETGAIFKQDLFQDVGTCSHIAEYFNEQGALLKRNIGDTSYIYDDCGRVARIEKNGILLVTKEYQCRDGLVEETSRFTGQGHLVEVRQPTGQLVNRSWYDGNAKILLTESLLTTDDKGSIKLQQKTASETREFEWRMGANQRLQEVIGPNNRHTSYTYDAQNRLISQKNTNACAICYEYEGDRLTRMYAQDGSLDYTYSYDTLGRIVEITDTIAQKTVHRKFDLIGRIIMDGETDCSCMVDYTPSGDIKSIILPDSSTIMYDDRSVTRSTTFIWKACLGSPKKTVSQSTYTTDPLNQLVQEQGDVSYSYSFDFFGRPVQQLQDASFDEDGNCTSIQEPVSERLFTYDALGRLKRCEYDGHTEEYRYDGLGRLSEIKTDKVLTKVIHLDTMDLGSIRKGKIQELRILHPRTKELLYLEMGERHYQVALDANGSIVALYDTIRNSISHMYSYTAFGTCVSKTSPKEQKPFLSYRFYGKRLLPLAKCYDFGPRRLNPQLLRWLEADPLGVVDTVDDRIFCRNNPTIFSDSTGLFPQTKDFADFTQPIFSSIQQMISNTYRSITFASHRLDWIMEIRSQYETLFFSIMGRSWLRLMGYNLDPTSEETTGQGSLPQKARVTVINGILNGVLEAQRMARIVSQLHGNIPVYYVYSATHGFAGDILRGTFYKVGIVSEQSKILIKLWRRLIKEMGGINGGGVIWHYAHSLGATDTATALARLDPEERSMLRVATFGSPTILEADACAKVDNYISVHDAVPCLDPIRYFLALRNHDPHVHFLPSNTPPLVDHGFSGNTYRTVLTILGKEFQDEFLYQTSTPR
jgi:RHS repeat-associated protein